MQLAVVKVQTGCVLGVYNSTIAEGSEVLTFYSVEPGCE